MFRALAALVVAALAAAACHASPDAVPLLRLVPSLIVPEPVVATPADPYTQHPTALADEDGFAGWRVVGYGGAPIVRFRSALGHDLYGFDVGDGESDLGVGAAPILSGLRTTGYVAGFHYVKGRWTLNGDLESGHSQIGQRQLTSSLQASVRMTRDLSFRLLYLSRNRLTGWDRGRGEMVGGSVGFEF